MERKLLEPEIRKLAKKAGFILWDTADWGPGKDHIDWSCEYDEELARFAKLIQKRMKKHLEICRKGVAQVEDLDYNYAIGYDDAMLDAIEIVLRLGKGYVNEQENAEVGT